MSDTPWTDNHERVGKIRSSGAVMGVVPAVYVRELETELAEALETSAIRSRIVNKQTLELAEARAEIERLKQELRGNSTIVSPAVLALNDATAELVRKDKLIEQMREALNWYKEQVSNCNRNGDIGETARDQLAKDVGKRAEAALSAAECFAAESRKA